MKMYRISAEDSKNLRKRMKKAATILQYRKMEAGALRGEGKKNDEISAITGFHSDMVGRFAKEYLEGGLDALLFDGRKGGNHRNASDSEEQEFIAQYEQSAEKGQVISVDEIAAAYDKRFGKEHKSKSTVYYLLHKLGFRKVMPRSKHPNGATPEAIEASKKLTKASKTRR
jgi:transposase